MKISPSYNPEESKFSIEFSTELLKDYFFNFRGMVLDSDIAPKDVEVTKKTPETALITFTVNREDMKSSEKSIPDEILSKFGSMLGISSENISGGVMVSSDSIPSFKNVQLIIQDFIKSASVYRFSKTEFVPLDNYSVELLKVDCKNAIEAKRDFCIVDDFIKYRKAMDDMSYVLNHITIPYGTSEYVDVALLIFNDRFEELVKWMSPRLENKAWLKY